MSITSAKQNLSRKAIDPMFLCMVGAMILAVGTSVMLRVVAGPRPAEASEVTVIPAPPVHPHVRAAARN